MSYNKIAPYYSLIEKIIFGNKLNQARTNLLSELPKGIGLVLGGGRGFVSNQLQNLGQTIKHVDASIQMVELSKKKNSNIDYICDDAFIFLARTSKKYDFICLPFFIDLFLQEEQVELLKLCAQKMHPHAKLWIADFQIPNTWFLKLRAQVYIKIMLLFFKYSTGLSINKLADWQSQTKFNFILEQHKISCGALISTNLYRLKS